MSRLHRRARLRVDELGSAEQVQEAIDSLHGLLGQEPGHRVERTRMRAELETFEASHRGQSNAIAATRTLRRSHR